MGTPSAYLGFAVIVDEDEWHERFGEEDGLDWEDAAAQAAGVPYPTKPYLDESTALYHEYWEGKEKALQSSGCVIRQDGHDGHDGDGTHYACARLFQTDWDGRLEIDPGSMVTTEEDVSRLRAFMKALGLTMTDEPKWMLFAYYG